MYVKIGEEFVAAVLFDDFYSSVGMKTDTAGWILLNSDKDSSYDKIAATFTPSHQAKIRTASYGYGVLWTTVGDYNFVRQAAGSKPKFLVATFRRVSAVQFNEDRLKESNTVNYSEDEEMQSLAAKDDANEYPVCFVAKLIEFFDSKKKKFFTFQEAKKRKHAHHGSSPWELGGKDFQELMVTHAVRIGDDGICLKCPSRSTAEEEEEETQEPALKKRKTALAK